MSNDVASVESAGEGVFAQIAALDREAAPQPTWIASEPKQRKRHFGLWFGIPGTLIVAAAVVASLVLIAPGVAVAGTSVGMSTQSAAQQAIRDRFSGMQIHIGGATLTAAQLGASIDAKKLAENAKSAHPLWNVTAWDPQPAEGAVTIDPAVALPALRKAAPQLFSNAKDATVVFDAASSKFTTTPAEPGRGVDVSALATSLTRALSSESGTAAALGGLASSGVSVTVEPKQTQVDAPATTAKAEAFAAELNAQAATAGYYVQGTRAAAIPLATIASWIDITSDPTTGDFSVAPKTSAIDAAMSGLPAQVDKKAETASVLINSAGKQLAVLQAGHDGFSVGDTSGLADEIAGSLTKGDLKFELQGSVVKHRTATVFRRIEVDKSEGATYLYQGTTAADAKRIKTFPVAIGKPGHDTRVGHYTVYAQLPSQDMGNCDNKHPQFDYCTKNVPWISYFDGDQGLHGTYWHNNFGKGARMSHGCVNMRIPDALTVYHFAQIGTEVWVHD